MRSTNPFPRHLALPIAFGESIIDAAVAIAERTGNVWRIRKGVGDVGLTLRPGKSTPLWNQLRKEVQSTLRKRGDQAQLGRLLGLPRQRVNAFVTRGTQMPDAERTLLLVAWLVAVRKGERPR